MADCVEISAGGLETSMLVDKARLAHYGVQVEEHSGIVKATSWIASEVDKEFAINASVETLPKSKSYAAFVYIDGQSVASALFSPDSEKRSHTFSGVWISPTEERKFMFGALEFIDDESHAEAVSANTPGEIAIILKSSDGPVTVGPPGVRRPFVDLSHDKVYEGLSKGMTHQVKYSEPCKDMRAPFKRICYLANTIIVAKHVIKYRPLAILQANGIVPLPPPMPTAEITLEAPSSSELIAREQRSRKRRPAEGQAKTEPEPEEDTDPEERIRKRRRELMAELAKLEEEEDHLRASKRTRRSIKQEIKQEPRATAASGEVVDLTI